MRTAVASAILLLGVACHGASSDTTAAHAQRARRAVPSAPPRAIPVQVGTTGVAQRLAQSRSTAIVTAAARVAPAVVSVNIVKRERTVPNDPWTLFFVPRGYERTVQGLGSGFILTPDGIVITNQHVTEGADSIVVTTRDGTDYRAKLLGEDPLTDIAVLKIDGHGLPTAPIGSSRDLLIGEWVVAIGNPYGYLLGNTEPTVTAGVVSGVDRNLLPNSDQPGVYVGMIQTDAAINPGNSGGPLVNAAGQVVGVNSSILSNSGGSVGLGFAIPIERALRVARELERHGSVRRAWVGVDVSGVQHLRDWKRLGGLAITRVADGSPAARAGLERGDVIDRADGQTIRTFLDWESVKLDVIPGDTLNVRYLHDGAQHHAHLVVEDLPSSRAEKVDALGGIRLITVTPAVQQERSIQSAHGALIYSIASGTQDQTGLKAGDVIIQINRERIASAQQARSAFEHAAGRGALRVYFERHGQIGYADFYVR